jgi:hypothetical protein
MINHYFKNLKLSFYSLDHYKKVIKQPLRKSLGFLLVSVLLLGILWSTYLAFGQLVNFIDQTKLNLNEAKHQFPDDLVIVLNENGMTLNRESFVIGFPEVKNRSDISLPDNFVYLHNSTLTPEELSITNKDTLFFINQNMIYSSVMEPNSTQNLNQWEVQNFPTDTMGLILNESDELIIDKTMVDWLVAYSEIFLDKNLLVIQLLFIALNTISFIASKLWLLLIQSILVFLIFKIYAFNLGFKQVMGLTANIIVPTSALVVITNILYPTVQLPMQTIAFWTVLAFITYGLREQLIRNKKIN